MHVKYFLWLAFLSFFHGSDAHAAALNPQAKPIQIRQVASLRFGNFASEGSGTLTIDAKGGFCKPAGRVALFASSTCNKGEFEIMGRPGAQVMIQPSGETTMTGTTSAELRLRDFTVYPENVLTLGADGRARFSVGATLQVSRTRARGDYQGMFTVDVVYLN